MTADWTPSQAVVDWARERGWDALDEATVGEFRDYWLREGKPMADWDAAYRHRLRKLNEWGKVPLWRPTPTQQPAPSEPVADAVPPPADILARMDALFRDVPDVGQPPPPLPDALREGKP